MKIGFARDANGSLRRSQRGGIVSRLIFLLGFVLFVGVVYLARHPLMRAAGNFWIVEDAPEHADVIVMLGDDNFAGERAARAAELYHAGWAPRVVASGRQLRPYAGIAELEERDLEQLGVPQGTIVVFSHRANDTLEECSGLGDLLSKNNWRKVLLVTSNFHTRRARYICERVLPPGTDLRVIAAKDSDFNADAWWETRQGIKIFFHECLGLVVAIWELRHRSEQTSESALSPSREGLRTPGLGIGLVAQMRAWERPERLHQPLAAL
ncbi:MAG: YdcF family protein [Candidatus Acidiferrales bacterium]